MINYNASEGVTPADLVYLKTVTKIPLVAVNAGRPALLTVKVTHNSNPDVIEANLEGHQLKLQPKQAGTSTITLRAKDAAGRTTKTHFTVTVDG